MKTLNTQFKLIKEGKGNKDVFLKQAKKQYPNLLTNSSTFKEATNILKQKGVLSENFIGSEAINMMVPRKKESFESAFEAFLNEEAKAEEKKTSKEVEDIQDENYDNKDDADPNNMIFDQILTGYYAELRDPKNADKTEAQLKDIVFKNLKKDPIYYTKDGQFGVKGLGYVTDAPGLGEPKEPKGPHKSSGYGTLKENKHLNESNISTIDQYIKSEKDTKIKNALTKIRGKFLNKEKLTPAETKLINKLIPHLLKENKKPLIAPKVDIKEGFYSSPSDMDETGLNVIPKNQIHANMLKSALENSGLYAEWNAREGYFFFPEEQDLYDQLEMEIQDLMDENNIQAYIEGVFNENKVKPKRPLVKQEENPEYKEKVKPKRPMVREENEELNETSTPSPMLDSIMDFAEEKYDELGNIEDVEELLTDYTEKAIQNIALKYGDY